MKNESVKVSWLLLGSWEKPQGSITFSSSKSVTYETVAKCCWPHDFLLGIEDRYGPLMIIVCKMYLNYSTTSGSHSLSDKKVNSLLEPTYFMFCLNVCICNMCVTGVFGHQKKVLNESLCLLLQTAMGERLFTETQMTMQSSNAGCPFSLWPSWIGFSWLLDIQKNNEEGVKT